MGLCVAVLWSCRSDQDMEARAKRRAEKQKRNALQPSFPLPFVGSEKRRKDESKKKEKDMFSRAIQNNLARPSHAQWRPLYEDSNAFPDFGSASTLSNAGDNGAPWPETVDVDWREWVGTWYEVARLPVPYEADCAGRPRATYTARTGSSVIDVTNDCVGAQGRSGRIRVRGAAVPVGPGRLWVDFGRAAPGSTAAERALGNYWILYVDPTYSEAIVATPDLQSAWALSRYPCPEPQAVASLLERMHGLGIDIRRLVIH